MKSSEFLAVFRPIIRLGVFAKPTTAALGSATATFNHAPDWGMPAAEIRPGVTLCEPAMQAVSLEVPLPGPVAIEDPQDLKKALELLPREISARYPYWRTEALAADSRPLINGQKGRIHIGLTVSSTDRWSAFEIELQGLAQSRVIQARLFYTNGWHAWESMPSWMREAVEMAAGAGARVAIVDAITA